MENFWVLIGEYMLFCIALNAAIAAFITVIKNFFVEGYKISEPLDHSRRFQEAVDAGDLAREIYEDGRVAYLPLNDNGKAELEGMEYIDKIHAENKGLFLLVEFIICFVFWPLELYALMFGDTGY